MGFPASDVLAHRGLWSAPLEQNTRVALTRALNLGFGLETDIRDHNGDLVISHDMPTGREDTLADLLSWSNGHRGLLALNVKADGLHVRAKEQLFRSLPHECFFFDMSLPQARLIEQANLPFAARVSEFEGVDGLLQGPYSKALYLWIDCFERDWFLECPELSEAMISRVSFLVSPEIHKRSPYAAWNWIRSMRSLGRRVGVCTDRPLEFVAWQNQGLVT